VAVAGGSDAAGGEGDGGLLWWCRAAREIEVFSDGVRPVVATGV
jgi:hypothetical protein